MFVSNAYAAEVVPVASSFDLWSLLPMVLVVVVFYFLLIRPQQKKAKRHRTMLDAIKVGDKLTTAGGMICTVNKINGDVLHVNLNDTTVVEIVRTTIARIHSHEEIVQQKKSSKISHVAPTGATKSSSNASSKTTPKPPRSRRKTTPKPAEKKQIKKN